MTLAEFDHRDAIVGVVAVISLFAIIVAGYRMIDGKWLWSK